MNRSRNTAGLVSLSLFGVGMVLLSLTVVLTYLPRDNDFRSLLSWMGLWFGFGFMFLGIPLLLASFVTSIVSIAKIQQQRIGYVVLGGNLLLTTGVILWLFR